MLLDLITPYAWFHDAANAPRPIAGVCLLVAATMCVMGSRLWRLYIIGGAGLLGWFLGEQLGDAMHVNNLYLAIPTAGVAAAIAAPRKVARPLLWLAIAVMLGAVCGSLLESSLQVANFWIGFAAGTAVAIFAGVIAKHFTEALFFASVGSTFGLTFLGAVVQAESGILARAGFDQDFPVFVITAVVLVVGSMVLQAVFNPHPEERSL